MATSLAESTAKLTPRTGPTSTWLRTEPHETYQTPWQPPLLNPGEEAPDERRVRKNCTPPGPGFPPTAIAGINYREDRVVPGDVTPLARMNDDSYRRMTPSEAKPVLGRPLEVTGRVTREPTGVPKIGGYDRRPAHFEAVGLDRKTATPIAAMEKDNKGWCLEE
jgi:hypothetical protein